MGARGCSVLFALALVGCGASVPADGTDAGPGADGGGGGTDAGSSVVGPVPESEHAGVLARAWCASRFACDCPGTFPDEATCVARVEESVASQAMLFRDQGLTYDDRCAAVIVREIELRGCLGYEPVEVGCEACNLYHGDVARGEACENVGVLASNCAAGLACLARSGAATCEDPCEALPRFVGPGEACGDATCHPLGAYCDAGVCASFPSAGEACDRGMCSLDAYCDRAIDQCAPARPRGEACVDGTECVTRNCAGGVCASFCGPRPF